MIWILSLFKFFFLNSWFEFYHFLNFECQDSVYVLYFSILTITPPPPPIPQNWPIYLVYISTGNKCRKFSKAISIRKCVCTYTLWYICNTLRIRYAWQKTKEMHERCLWYNTARNNIICFYPCTRARGTSDSFIVTLNHQNCQPYIFFLVSRTLDAFDNYSTYFINEDKDARITCTFIVRSSWIGET